MERLDEARGHVGPYDAASWDLARAVEGWIEERLDEPEAAEALITGRIELNPDGETAGVVHGVDAIRVHLLGAEGRGARHAEHSPT